MSSPHHNLNFGPRYEEVAAIVSELKAIGKHHDASLSTSFIPAYTMILRLPESEIDSTFLSPEEARMLLAECLEADEYVKSPRAIRGLDKLIRIAHQAESLHLGILFAGED